MFAALDWHSRDFYVYLAVGGAAAAVLGIVLYVLPGGRLRLPGGAVSVLGSLALGLGLGVLLMFAFRYQFEEPQAPPSSPRVPDIGVAGRGPPGGEPQAPGGGRGGRGGRGGGGPNYKNQLALLVDKLDVLTEKPLTVRLDDEQRKQVKEQLKGLADADELSDDDAQKRVEELHKVLKDQESALEAAGYNWSGQGGGRGGGRGGAPEGNPFKTETNAKHLKSLSERLNQQGA
jgi:hypothetical protein